MERSTKYLLRATAVTIPASLLTMESSGSKPFFIDAIKPETDLIPFVSDDIASHLGFGLSLVSMYFLYKSMRARLKGN